MTSKKSTGYAYQWYVVLLLMLAQTFSFIDRMILGLLVGPIRESFDISDTQFSLLVGFAFALFYALMGLPLARIADRYSRKILIAVGISVWSVMTALCGLAQGYWGLFLARMGVGVGEASLSPAAYSMIADLFPKKLLGRALSLFTFGVAIGSGLAYLVGGKVIQYINELGQVEIPFIGTTEPWQLTFFAVGIPGLLIAVAILISVKEPERQEKISDTNAIPISEVIGFMLDKKRVFIPHILGLSIFIMVVYSLNIWGPTYLIRTFQYSPAEAGLIMGGLLFFGVAIGLFLGGYLGDKWLAQGQYDAYSRVILLSIICILPFTIILGMDVEPVIAIPVLGVALMLSGMQGGIGGGLLQLVTPNEMRGQITAVYFLLANLIGLGLGPTVIAIFTDYVFQNDAAIGKSLALNAVILCPIAFMIMASGLSAVRAAVSEIQNK